MSGDGEDGDGEDKREDIFLFSSISLNKIIYMYSFLKILDMDEAGVGMKLEYPHLLKKTKYIFIHILILRLIFEMSKWIELEYF
jgi:hypothetical protein